MSDGIAREFFEDQKIEDKVKLEEDRLMARITQSRPVKEAEGSQVRSAGKEITIEWRKPTGEIISQIKVMTDRGSRLPLQKLIDAWHVKNIRFFEGGVAMKVMLDGHSDLPVRDKNSTVVGILADTMTAEEIEADSKAQAVRSRNSSIGTAAPARKLSGAAAVATQRKPMAQIQTNIPEEPVKSVKSSNPPVANKSSSSSAPSVNSGEVVCPPAWHLSEDERKKREAAEEERMWQQVARGSRVPNKST